MMTHVLEQDGDRHYYELIRPRRSSPELLIVHSPLLDIMEKWSKAPIYDATAKSEYFLISFLDIYCLR